MSQDIFTKRGITPPWKPDGEVARRQGFARYEGATYKERRAALAAIDPAFGSDEPPPPPESRESSERYEYFGPWDLDLDLKAKDPYRSWRSWLQMALDVDGWAMPRHSVMPDHSDFADAPWTQLRPDVPVNGHFERHTHKLLRAEPRGREEVAPRTRHEAKLCELDGDGNLLASGHLHPETGEVCVPFTGRHAHWKHAKYLYTPGGTAKRLGTNPLNVERQFAGDLFVVVMEGTLKMCSVTEAGYPCIDAGSVTLWSSERESGEYDEENEMFYGGWLYELEEFARRHLKGRTVAVVCDSDWYANRAVRNQTKRVARILDPLVARAVACAPAEGRSYGWHHPITGMEMRQKRGIDDGLGEQACDDRHDAFLDEVGFYEPVRNADLTIDDPRLNGSRADGRKTTVDLLKAMGALAPPGSSVAPFAKKHLMARIGRSKKTTEQALDRAFRCGLAEPVLPAERAPRAEGGFYMEPALVRVTEAALPQYEWQTLRQWLG